MNDPQHVRATSSAGVPLRLLPRQALLPEPDVQSEDVSGAATPELLVVNHDPADLIGAGVPGGLGTKTDVEWTGRPRVWLRTMGEPSVDGVVVDQLLAVPFLLAAAARAMGEQEVAEVTGYARKTIANVFTTSHPVVNRRDGMLVLSDGVWSDVMWLTECSVGATRALAANDTLNGNRWVAELLTSMQRIEAPFGRVPTSKVRGRRKAMWAWVDEFPTSVSARREAEQAIVAAARSLGLLMLEHGDALQSLLRISDVVEVLLKAARELPQVAVRPIAGFSELTSATVLLVLATRVAGPTDEVRFAARSLIEAGEIDPSDEFADLLNV